MKTADRNGVFLSAVFMQEWSEGMQHKTYGYIRVSSRDQNEQRQRIAMEKQGLKRRDTYVDKQSGKDFERPAYKQMMERMKPGDLLYVQSIDRLGRNYAEVQEQWRILTKEKKVDVCVIDMPLLDTRQGKDLLGTFIADLVLQILSFVAQSEREFIKKRQAEGIAVAKANGVSLGRKPRALPENYDEEYQKWKRGEKTGVAAAKACGMPLSTFRYRAERHEAERKGNGE